MLDKTWECTTQVGGSIPLVLSTSTRTRLWHVIRETVAGDFGRFDYAATGNKVVGCAW